MARLYEISGVFAQLFNSLDELIDDSLEAGEELSEAEQAWYDTLEGIEAEFEEKAESVAQYIKELTARVEAIKSEEKKLAARRRACENKAAGLKLYLKRCMEQMNLRKVETGRAKIMMRNNAATLVILDEGRFIRMLLDTGHGELLKVAEPEIRRTDVKALLKAGEKLEGAELVTTKSLIII